MPKSLIFLTLASLLFINCKDSNNIIATVDYNKIIMPAIIQHNYSYGCQFHPEKSGPEGLSIIKRFLDE